MTFKSSPLKIDEDRFLSAVNVRPAKDGTGAILLNVVNPTDEPITTKVKPQPPYTNIFRSDTAIEKFEIGPGETVPLRVE